MRIQKKAPNSAAAAAAELKREQIVIIPTDTIYGFSGLIGKTAETIAHIKGREENKPFIALIAEPADIYRYTDIVIPERLLALWPAPLTLIVPLKGTEQGTQAFRCPADEFEDSVSLVVDGGNLEGLPSTLVDLTSGAPRVLRQGSVVIK